MIRRRGPVQSRFLSRPVSRHLLSIQQRQPCTLLFVILIYRFWPDATARSSAIRQHGKRHVDLFISQRGSLLSPRRLGQHQRPILAETNMSMSSRFRKRAVGILNRKTAFYVGSFVSPCVRPLNCYLPRYLVFSIPAWRVHISFQPHCPIARRTPPRQPLDGVAQLHTVCRRRIPSVASEMSKLHAP